MLQQSADDSERITDPEMFDLEKAIASWRWSFRYRRVFFEEDLEELERHVRDHTAWLVEQGWTEKEAFGKAVRRVSDYALMEQEYRKVFWAKIKHRRRILREILWRGTMLTNYLKIALRNFKKHKGYACINVAGLAVGLACCLFIYLFVRDELRYDRFHEKADRIYRVIDGMRFSEAFPPSAITPSAWAPVIAAEMPEVVTTARLRSLSRFNPLVRYQDKTFYEYNLIAADSSLFDVFSFELVRGHPERALSDPAAVVITEAIAQKYFGGEDPLGKTLTFDDEMERVVTGVLKDLPSTSSFTFDFVFPLVLPEPNRVWTHSFLVLREGVFRPDFEKKLARFVQARWKEAPYAPRQTLAPVLQPLTEIHLHSKLQFEFGPNSDVVYVYLLSTIAVLILVVACINFMNLATARLVHRRQEVGVRKVLGARRGQLINQFLGESLMLSFIALLLALVLVGLLLPAVNALMGKNLGLDAMEHAVVLVGLIGVGVLVGLAAGSYPAFVLSTLQPAGILKGMMGDSASHAARLRKGLVVIQFTLTLVIIIGTGIVYQQLDYFRNERLGFDKEHVVVLNARNPSIKAQREAFKRDLLQAPQVVQAAFAQSLPGQVERMASLVYRFEGQDETKIIRTFTVDFDFVETLGVDVVEGRTFSRAFATDSSGFLINETAARALGWTNPVGKRVEEINQGWEGTVIGVVKDFHVASLHQEIEPVVLHVVPARWFNVAVVRIRSKDVAGTLRFLEAQWRRFAPDHPFEYSFLDADFDSLYRAEERLSRVLSSFALLALFVACLGLFALASFTTGRRTKEVGVRKVLGASVSHIVVLLTQDFLKPVGVAFLVAVPVAYVAADRWLENFAYRIEISWPIFLIVGLAALGIALVTVSYQAIRAALADPVKALRYE